MQQIPQRTKDPSAKKVYSFDWENDLYAGTSIISSAWSVEPAIAGDTPGVAKFGTDTVTGYVTACGFEGGALGETCFLRNDVTITPNGEVLVKRIELRIELE